MERLAGGETIDQFDAADLDHPIALNGIKPGGLGIENDLAHVLLVPLVARQT